MDARAVQRFARQITLPEIGPDGQARLGAARVAVAGGDLTAEVIARYLAAAGIGALRLVGAGPAADAALRASNPDVAIEHAAWPDDGAAWLAALEGATLVARSGFDDDAMLHATQRLGIPAVVVRARAGGVDLLSFTSRPPELDAALDHRPARTGEPPHQGAAAVVAGTLAATESIHALLGRQQTRLLRLPLDGGEPVTQEIPWGHEASLR